MFPAGFQLINHCSDLDQISDASEGGETQNYQLSRVRNDTRRFDNCRARTMLDNGNIACVLRTFPRCELNQDCS
jgi:hypothetical protein